MNRSLLIVLGALFLGAALFAGSFAISHRICRVCVEQPPGSLDWMQRQFHLNDDAMARIQKLHDNYLTECKAMCRMIAEKQEEVAAAMENTTNVSPVAKQKLTELAACRAQCQSRMLQYFIDVSHNMPPAEGKRYLAQMRRLALGFPGGNGQSSSESAGHEHQP